MKVKANLFISNNGDLRVTKKYTAANPRELAVQLIIDIPDVFFYRPMPKVELAIPEEYLIDPGTEIVAKWVAPNIAEALKLEVKTVEDGLLTMFKTNSEEVAEKFGREVKIKEEK